ncbi:MAG: TcaA NTF2-like domain-containing protein [Ignavibacterium sp.]
MRKLKLNSFVLLSIIFFVSCSSKKSYDTPEALVNANVDFMNQEDFDGVMSTIHPQSPSYEMTEKLVKKIFEVYDLNYKIEKLKVLEKNDNEAKIEFVQITTKLKGPDFKNNKTNGVHTLKMDGSSWKIFSTEVQDLEFL